MSVLYLAAAIVLEICGTTSLKLSQGFTRIGPTGAVAVCYAASFALLSLALRGIDLSIAYAVWSGVGTAIVASIGIIWFDEPAGAWKLLSLALIVPLVGARLVTVQSASTAAQPRNAGSG
ncbi:MAG: multidrug efflux SMR transporter [Alphaproteobacteria bacterium]|nr:MAG: multidrug efflux SMR transporter [Alphaproteobacteria bacterium]